MTRHPFLDDGDVTRADLERDECACVVCGEPTWSLAQLTCSADCRRELERLEAQNALRAGRQC